MLKFIQPFLFDKDDIYILEALNQAEQEGISSMRVIGRGLVTVDVNEVIKTQRFKEYRQRATSLVNNL